jgi:tRNA-dihydrouridine synthase
MGDIGALLHRSARRGTRKLIIHARTRRSRRKRNPDACLVEITKDDLSIPAHRPPGPASKIV